MLEVVNLSKIYKTKGGANVTALNNVSLRFPEKGMVFLLGKSGSGKSTLLNVCGGLDSPTSGEIIVKGRSSKKFTQSDFDSYRNTFIGFIFQEYNILNEFTVEDNIALALELQGKSKDRAAINKLLEQVDLKGLAKRKPNTLSGGQKQRIAIARALIKSPEIIMADEPTGALDSNTGKQVFSTLKKLSKDKLVIIVSHDRDFAEQYGDRIIELKDGKILSDVVKSEAQKNDVSENVSIVDGTICVKSGADLSDNDLGVIKDFLKNTENDVIISNNKKDVKTFKAAARISDSGVKEIFSETDEGLLPKKVYTPQDSRFIRSKLPMKHAVKIGASNLKIKPFRLFLTILLCVVGFTMFGFVSTMMFYNSDATFVQTLEDRPPAYVRLENEIRYETVSYDRGEESDSYESELTVPVSEKFLAAVREKYDDKAFGAASIYEAFNLTEGNSYYNNTILYAACYDSSYGVEILSGRAPEADNEIMVSSYIADAMINCKLFDAEGTLLDGSVSADPDDRYAVVRGKKISIFRENVTIVGVFDSGEIDPRFESLQESSGNLRFLLELEFSSYLNDGLYQMIFVSQNRLLEIAKEIDYTLPSIDDVTKCACVFVGSTAEAPIGDNTLYRNFSTLNTIDTVFLNGKTTIADNEAIISFSSYLSLLEILLNNAELGEDDYNYYSNILGELMQGYVLTESGEHHLTKDDKIARLNTLCEVISLDCGEIELTLLNNETWQLMPATKKTFTVVGYTGMMDDLNDDAKIYLSESAYNSLWDTQVLTSCYSVTVLHGEVDWNAPYQMVFVPFDGSKKMANELLSIYKNKSYDENGSRLVLNCASLFGVQIVDTVIEPLGKVFLWCGIIIAIFAALLLSNFISLSITNKKREIGILRAVGARGIDVFKIFFFESFFITSVCTVASICFTLIFCRILNNYISALIGASVFNFGFLSTVVVVSIAMLTAVVATLLPVIRAASKKPVESIRAL